MPVERGQVWKLGQHRLMCGDATNADDMNKLMDGEKATLCFADPPYGMKKENDGVLNDNLNYSDLLEFNRQWVPLSLDALTDIGSWYCWGQDRPLMEMWSFILRPEEKTRPLTFRNLITWDKGNGQGQNSDNTRSYAIADEKCLFVMKGMNNSFGSSSSSLFYCDCFEPIRQYLNEELDKVGWSKKDVEIIMSTVNGFQKWFTKSGFYLMPRHRYETLQTAAEGRAFTRPYDEIRAAYDEAKKSSDRHERIRAYNENCRAYFNNTHDNMNDVWHFNRTKAEERLHPTTKPLDVCARAIKSSSREGDIVLDPFAGGGSTLIACERLGRTCYTMELSPDWCQVVIDRWEAETGEHAELLGG